VAAIDFRGYGVARRAEVSIARDEMYLDVLAAVDYLRGHGARTVAVIGASMGGGASANAVVKGAPGAIDQLILLAPVPIENPERIAVPKLYAAAKDDPVTAKMKEQYEKAPQPKELLILEGSAHAQNFFPTDQGERLMKEIIGILKDGQTAVASKP
jgi:alpha-beta hydrolase superfamily lysophospholipase